MPDTLTEIRARDAGKRGDNHTTAKKDRRALLAHIDALTAAAAAVSDAIGNMALAVSKVPTQPQYLIDALELLKERDDAVLAILGEASSERIT